MVSPPTLQRHKLAKSIHATFLYPTASLPPFSMQWWCVDAVVVTTGGWCVEKKRNIHTEDTTYHGENEKKKKKMEKKKVVPSIELANFDWIV